MLAFIQRGLTEVNNVFFKSVRAKIGSNGLKTNNRTLKEQNLPQINIIEMSKFASVDVCIKWTASWTSDSSPCLPTVHITVLNTSHNGAMICTKDLN